LRERAKAPDRPHHGDAPTPLSVAFVMPGVGAVERGAEAFVVELCTALAAMRGASGESSFDATLYCRRPRPELPVRQRRLRVVRRDLPWLVRLYGATRVGRKILDTLFLDPLNVEWDSAALAALPALFRNRSDVVVMEGGLVGAWACRVLRRLRGTPFVDVAHGSSRKWEGAFARQKPDRVVTFTRAAAAMIAEEAPAAKVEVIPHGVDLARFRPDGPVATVPLEPPVVLVAGAVDEHKRLHLAVEAVAELGRGSLLVLGDGPAAPALDVLAGRRLGSRRYLRRQVPRADMPDHYRAAAVVTLPSISESFGLVYLEAMACGVPCVAPDDAVRREVLGGIGALCDPDDPAVYAEALHAVLGRNEQAAARRRAAGFSFDVTAECYARLLRELAGRSTD
jgi:glycosyltransferase involved in cell wall biosynthesis